MDEELFELSKEVHKRFPKWGIEIGRWWHKGSEVNGGNYITHYSRAEYEKNLVICPEFTSDFVLGKIRKSEMQINFDFGNDSVLCEIFTDQSIYDRAVSDTPLKALLKLIVALDDAGVIL